MSTRWLGQQHIQIPAPGTESKPVGNGAIMRARRREFDALTFAEAVTS